MSVNFIFGPYPILTQCPNCKEDVFTFIERNPNSTALLIGLFAAEPTDDVVVDFVVVAEDGGDESIGSVCAGSDLRVEGFG